MNDLTRTYNQLQKFGFYIDMFFWLLLLNDSHGLFTHQ